MKMKIFAWILVIGVLLTACSDFLEEYSQDRFHPSSANDLNELLIGDGYWRSFQLSGLDGMTDDAREFTFQT